MLLNSRDKTPYLVYLEVVDTSDLVAAQQVALTASGAPPTTPFQNAVQQDTAQPSPTSDLRDTSGYGADTEDRDTPPQSPRQSPRFPGMVPSPPLPLGPVSRGSFWLGAEIAEIVVIVLTVSAVEAVTRGAGASRLGKAGQHRGNGKNPCLWYGI